MMINSVLKGAAAMLPWLIQDLNPGLNPNQPKDQAKWVLAEITDSYHLPLPKPVGSMVLLSLTFPKKLININSADLCHIPPLLDIPTLLVAM